MSYLMNVDIRICDITTVVTQWSDILHLGYYSLFMSNLRL